MTGAGALFGFGIRAERLERLGGISPVTLSVLADGELLDIRDDLADALMALCGVRNDVERAIADRGIAGRCGLCGAVLHTRIDGDGSLCAGCLGLVQAAHGSGRGRL